MKKYFVLILIVAAFLAATTEFICVNAADLKENSIVSIEEVTASYAYGIGVSVKYTSTKADNVCFVIAMYDSLENLLGLEVCDVDVSETENGEVKLRFEAAEGTKSVKVFLWSSIKNLIPVYTRTDITDRDDVSSRISFWGNDLMAGIGSAYLNMEDNIDGKPTYEQKDMSNWIYESFSKKIDVKSYADKGDDYFDFFIGEIKVCSGDVLILNLSNDKVEMNPEATVENCLKMLDNLSYSDKAYVVIGFLNGTDKSEQHNDKVFEEAFGEHYLNLRNSLADYDVVRKYCGNELSNEDSMMIKLGRVPECFRSDEIHLNNIGYRAATEILKNKIEMLKYIMK